LESSELEALYDRIELEPIQMSDESRFKLMPTAFGYWNVYRWYCSIL